MNVEWKSCFRVGVSVVLIYLVIHYWSNIAGLGTALLGAAAPLLIGCVIAYLVNILMSFYEKHYFPKSNKPLVAKSRRSVCMVAAMITLVAVVVLIVWLIVPQLMSCVQLLLAEVPDALKSVVVVSMVSSVVSGIVTAFMAIIFSIYLLLGKDTIGRQCDRLMKRYLKKSWHDKIMHTLVVMHDCFRRYIIGQCTEAVILGLL